GPSGTDQYGRPIYGALVQSGGLLAAQPGSNRRFAGFDLVSALNPDGFSDYYGLTVDLERSVGDVRLIASYTYSQTTDNWISGLYSAGDPAGQLNPFPGGVGRRGLVEGDFGFRRANPDHAGRRSHSAAPAWHPRDGSVPLSLRDSVHARLPSRRRRQR